MRLSRLYFLFVICLIAEPFNLVAQKLTLSPKNLDEIGFDYLKVIGQDDSGVFVLHSNLSLELATDRIGLRSRKYRLSYFDFSLRPLWWRNISAHPENASLETVSFFNDKGMVISSEWNRNENSLLIYMDVYNAKGELEVTGKQIAALNIGRSANISKPKIILSASKLVAGIYIEEIHDDIQTIHFIQCDTSFKNIIQAKASVTYSAKNIEFGDVVLSDEGKVALLCKVKEKDASSEKKKSLTFKLLLLQKGATQFVDYNVNDSQHQMNEASLAVDRMNNRIVVSGFYADKSSFTGAGILFSILDLANPVELIQHNVKVNDEARLKLIGDRNSGNNVSLFSYPIQKIILRNNGGAVLVAEATYLSEYSYYDYFTQTYNRRVEYHYDNVVVISLSPQGEILWSQVLRKDQASLDDEGIYASFSGFLNSEKLILFYNGDIGRGNEVVGFSINDLGKSETTSLSRIGDNISLLPRAGKQIDNETIIVPAINKKKIYLAKIEIQ